MTAQAKIVISAEDQSGQAFRAFQDNVQKSLKASDLMARSVAGILAGISIDQTIQYANALAGVGAQAERLAKVSGVNTSEFQAQAYAAERAGVGVEKYADILKDVQDKVGEFLQTGGGPLKDFFENIAPRVGVTAEQFRKLGGPDALQLYASSLEKANLSHGELTFYMEALASDSSLLLPLLRGNGEGMRKLSAEAKELGLVLSDKAIAETKKFNQELTRLAATAEGYRRSFALPIITEVNSIIEKFQEAQKEGKSFWRVLFLTPEEMEKKNREAMAFGLVPKGTQSVSGSIITDGDPRSAVRAMDRNLPWGPIESPTPRRRPKPEGNNATAAPGKGDRVLFDPEIEAITAEFDSLYRIADKRREQARQLFRDTLEPIDLLAEKEAEIEQLRRDGLISEETYLRARMKAADDYDDAIRRTTGLTNEARSAVDRMAEEALQTSKRVQEFLGDQLFGVLDGRFKDVGDAFSELLKRMVAESMSADIMDGLFGVLNSDTKLRKGGLLGDYGGAILKMIPSFEGGGYTGSGSRIGGADGKGGYLALLHPQESVIDHTKSATATAPTVIVNNHFSVGDVASVSMVMNAVAGSERRISAGIARSLKYGGEMG